MENVVAYAMKGLVWLNDHPFVVVVLLAVVMLGLLWLVFG